MFINARFVFSKKKKGFYFSKYYKNKWQNKLDLKIISKFKISLATKICIQF